MERLSKRPRLSLFANDPYDETLDNARAEHELVLKGRFEAIFAKFSEDFSGVGDEIDLRTGKIVVDNGHLSGMQSEKDIGLVTARSATPVEYHVANGRSMLRAMTVAPDRDDSYFENEGADDVIQSIENIATVIDISSDEEESDIGDEEEADDDDNDNDNDHDADDAMDIQRVDAHIKPDPSPLKRKLPSLERDQDSSDADSLFEIKQENVAWNFDVPVKQEQQESRPDSRTNREYRESSVDSLFVVNTPPASTTPAGEDLEEQEILSKFGDHVGREVIDFLARREQEERHIDPAWRIPVQIKDHQAASTTRSESAKQHTLPPPKAASIRGQSRSSHDKFDTNASPINGPSLWNAQRPSRKAGRIDKTQKRVRAESEDPLQDGFNSGAELDVSEFREDPDEDADVQRCTSILKRGICPWCRYDCGDFDKALTHVRVALQAARADRLIPGHNLEHMRRVRPKIMAKKRVHEARLTVGDLKAMIELHEVAGHDFDYIVKNKLLPSSHMNISETVSLYYRHRGYEEEDGGVHTRPWTAQEKRKFKELSSRPLTTLEYIRRSIKGRTNAEIGSILARKWLRESRGEVDGKAEIEFPDPEGVEGQNGESDGGDEAEQEEREERRQDKSREAKLRSEPRQEPVNVDNSDDEDYAP